VHTETRTETTGDPNTSGTSITTVITYNADGSVTVDTTTDTWAPNPDDPSGKPVHTPGTPTHRVIAANDPTAPGWQGPVQQAEHTYGTTGTYPDPGY
jgi:hypothetical protein